MTNGASEELGGAHREVPGEEVDVVAPGLPALLQVATEITATRASGPSLAFG